MTMQRRQHRAECKAKVALEEVATLFSRRRGAKVKESEALRAALYQQIGRLFKDWHCLGRQVSGSALSS